MDLEILIILRLEACCPGILIFKPAYSNPN